MSDEKKKDQVETSFTVEEILMEYKDGVPQGHTKPVDKEPLQKKTAPPPQEVPSTPKTQKPRVASFSKDTSDEKPAKKIPDNVVEFVGDGGPSSDNPLAETLNKLFKKADAYADTMFQGEQETEEEKEDRKRAEKYLPGVDKEVVPPKPRERRPRPTPPPPPDLHPSQLHRRYAKGQKILRLRMTMAFILTALMAYITVVSAHSTSLLDPLALSWEAQLHILVVLQVGVMLLGLDVLLGGVKRIFTLRMGMDSLLVLSTGVTLWDALMQWGGSARGGEVPYCVISALAIALYLRGRWHKREGQRVACRIAASSKTPYLVTLDEKKWNGMGTYSKWGGAPHGFGRQIQGMDGAQWIFLVATPLLALACLLFSFQSSVGQGRNEDFSWALSATLTAATSLSGALCYGLPWHKISRRLAKEGAALAGWDGVRAADKTDGILVTDGDLFPPGAVTLNGIKVFGDISVDRAVGIAATLVRDSGCGLERIFYDLLRSQGALYRRSSQFEWYEGGVAATVRGEQVWVGSSSFMNYMEVTLPAGLNVKNAVFCAVEGELIGIFALNYTLQNAVEPALGALINNGVRPVLATRDFNLIPDFLRRRFKLPVDKMDFPAVLRRVELSEEEQDRGQALTAVLCREGIGPYAEAVVAGRRLKWGVRRATLLACLGSLLGVLLTYYLTFVGAYSALSATNLLIFMVIWLIPPLMTTDWIYDF